VHEPRGFRPTSLLLAGIEVLFIGLSDPSTGNFSLLLHSKSFHPCQVEVSRNLLDWFPLQCVRNAAAPQLITDASNGSAARFYRARYVF